LNDYPIGTTVEGATVISVCDYGAFLRLREGVEGLVSAQDMPLGDDAPTIGDTVLVEVSSVDTMDRRLFLNMKNIGADKEGAAQRQKKALQAQADATPGTIGDLIKEKLGVKLGEIQKSEDAPAEGDEEAAPEEPATEEAATEEAATEEKATDEAATEEPATDEAAEAAPEEAAPEASADDTSAD
jgi:ribosomal protein S1